MHYNTSINFSLNSTNLSNKIKLIINIQSDTINQCQIATSRQPKTMESKSAYNTAEESTT